MADVEILIVGSVRGAQSAAAGGRGRRGGRRRRQRAGAAGVHVDGAPAGLQPPRHRARALHAGRPPRAALHVRTGKGNNIASSL